MNSFSFAPPSFAPKESQRNYVFVDEHNRHKRLKVMRACEGCRRRKIKCDAATTNTWPCSACVRLKLHCVPPTINYEGDFAQPESTTMPEQGIDGDGLEVGSLDAFQSHEFSSPFVSDRRSSHETFVPVSYANERNHFETAAFFTQPQDHSSSISLPFDSVPNTSPQIPDIPDEPFGAELYTTPPQQNVAVIKTPESWHSDHYSPEILGNALGDLKIAENGVAPYISHQKRNLAEAPALEDFDEYLRNLPLPSSPGQTVKIPPELMPSEEQAMEYFAIFFNDIHPYVPVINKCYFYQQWQTHRSSISPLLLEAMFACAGKLSDAPQEGAKWLALASKHADCFMDVPRLSTLQAMLLILKARESSPQRGYFFRSWMTIVTLVTMAKDLGLEDHYGLHQDGMTCSSTYNDCVTKTRLWQTLFVYELMIGAPQGRSDFAVDPSTVDLSVSDSFLGLDDSELQVSRNWIYMSRIIRNVRRMNDTYANLKKERLKDWGNDPRFVQLTPSFDTWLKDLPPDLHVSYPDDGALPWLPSHFVGNLNSYYELSLIMLHRPQLAASDSFAVDGKWKHHMYVCYTSAKKLCRLQEAILAQYGLPGLFCMQRGINFTIYAILTCSVLHLVAITSPDPDLNSDARDFFTRHMRILEQCTSAFPMPEMQAQIEPLREAFSADTSKPFVLKQSFPYSSPRSAAVRLPAATNGHLGTSSTRHSSMENIRPVLYDAGAHHHRQAPTPPVSAADFDSGLQSDEIQPTRLIANGVRRASYHHHPPVSTIQQSNDASWNPSRIFDQWNTAFGTPQSAQAAVSVPTKVAVPLIEGTQGLSQVQDSLACSLPQVTQASPRSVSYSAASIAPTFVSPSMWQSSVAAVYEGGLKRGWDYGDEALISPTSKRPR
ncbi:MAG: hypothetical protein M1825_002903 [Sarcosagium campestre]|nr:MAG: hypothetical protein M1825_002903 [Sarcosagium campestre]